MRLVDNPLTRPRDPLQDGRLQTPTELPFLSARRSRLTLAHRRVGATAELVGADVAAGLAASAPPLRYDEPRASLAARENYKRSGSMGRGTLANCGCCFPKGRCLVTACAVCGGVL